MGSAYDDLPTVGPKDLEFIGQKPAYLESYESACRDGSLPTVQSIVSSEIRSPAFLHKGLVLALTARNIDIARYLLSAGAPIVRSTPYCILSAPSDQQLPLFELLTHYGWTPNTPGNYGDVLLPRFVTNLTLLSWFLAHGANPNLGEQRPSRDRFGGPETNSCAALESAASRGDIEAVRMLLDAGAELGNGTPLHAAAGACPPGMNPHVARVTPGKEFDAGRISVMALLVERGADVNQRLESRYMEPRYAIVYAVMAGAVERVRWLLEQGADPEAGSRDTAISYASIGSEEMKRVVGEGLKARRWVKNDNVSRIVQELE